MSEPHYELPAAQDALAETAPGHRQPWPALRTLVPQAAPVPGLDLSVAFPDQSKWAASYIQGLADQIQVSPAMISPMLLSLASLAATGAIEYQGRPGHVEMPAIWTATLASPSERKSPVLRALRMPFQKPHVSIGEQYQRPKWSIENDDEEDEEGDEDHNHPDLLPTRWLDLMVSDITPTGMLRAMLWTDGRLGLISDEGYPVRQLIRATDQGGLDLYLRGWSGDSVTILRRHHKITFPSPEVVIGLLIQPAAASSMFQSDALIGRGLPQRILWSESSTIITARTYTAATSCPIHLESAWHDRIQSLLSIPRYSDQRRRLLHLDDHAMTVYAQLADRLDQERRNSKNSTFMQEWYGKSHGQALRIAGLVTLLGNPDQTIISPSAVAAAEGWISYFAAHTRAASVTTGTADSTHFHARRIASWIAERSLLNVTRSTITQSLRCHDLPKASDWNSVFDLLIENGYLRLIKTMAGTEGDRPSISFEVNPETLGQ